MSRSTASFANLLLCLSLFGAAANAAEADTTGAAKAPVPLALPDPWITEGDTWGGFYPAPEEYSLRSPIFPDYDEEAAISPYEPMYVVLGGKGGVTARFQFSFKYRVFDADSFVVNSVRPLRDFYLAYSQTSLWDLNEESKPFKDTSYRPSAFWQGLGPGRDGLPHLVRAGYEHESNGQADVQSRSIDMLFVQPIWRTSLHEQELVFAPKFYTYIEKEDNPDIHRYRGNVDWIVRYGSQNDWLAAVLVRGFTHGRGSVQLDLSYPLRAPVFYRAGGFFYVQLFQGYGESLLEYNKERGPSLRVGVGIVR